MKSIFKKIALFGATIMALASCASLLPNRSHRSRSNSDEIAELSYQGGTSQLINPSSPNSGGSSASSKDERIESSLYYLEGPEGTHECYVGEDTIFEYRVINYATGMSIQLKNFGFAYTSGGEIDIHGELQDNKTVLLFHINPNNIDVFEYTIDVEDINGQSYTRTNKIVASYHNFDTGVRIEYPSYVQTSPYDGFYLYLNAYELKTGKTLLFDRNRPFDIGHINESIISISSYQTALSGDVLELYFDVKGIGFDLVELKLILNDGSTYNIAIYFEVRPDVWFEHSNLLVVPYDDYIDVTFRALQKDKIYGTIDAHLDVIKSYIEVRGFDFEILDFYSSKIVLRIYNNNNVDYGDLLIHTYTQEGFYYYWGFQVISQKAYENDCWVNCDIQSVRYQQSGKIMFFLEGPFGRQTIKDIEATFKNGKIDNVKKLSLHVDYFEYQFVPNGYGDETMHVSITSEKGIVFEQEFSFYIDR